VGILLPCRLAASSTVIPTFRFTMARQHSCRARGRQNFDAEFRTGGIEKEFSKIAEEVRTRYTLDYIHDDRSSRQVPHPRVKVLRPNLTVDCKKGLLGPRAVRQSAAACHAVDLHDHETDVAMNMDAMNSLLGGNALLALGCCHPWGGGDLPGGMEVKRPRQPGRGLRIVPVQPRDEFIVLVGSHTCARRRSHMRRLAGVGHPPPESAGGLSLTSLLHRSLSRAPGCIGRRQCLLAGRDLPRPLTLGQSGIAGASSTARLRHGGQSPSG